MIEPLILGMYVTFGLNRPDPAYGNNVVGGLVGSWLRTSHTHSASHSDMIETCPIRSSPIDILVRAGRTVNATRSHITPEVPLRVSSPRLY